MRRQRWLLLIAALACLGSLLLWIAEIDVGIEESLPPQAWGGRDSSIPTSISAIQSNRLPRQASAAIKSSQR